MQKPEIFHFHFLTQPVFLSTPGFCHYKVPATTIFFHNYIYYRHVQHSSTSMLLYISGYCHYQVSVTTSYLTVQYFCHFFAYFITKLLFLLISLNSRFQSLLNFCTFRFFPLPGFFSTRFFLLPGLCNLKFLPGFHVL